MTSFSKGKNFCCSEDCWTDQGNDSAKTSNLWRSLSTRAFPLHSFCLVDLRKVFCWWGEELFSIQNLSPVAAAQSPSTCRRKQKERKRCCHSFLRLEKVDHPQCCELSWRVNTSTCRQKNHSRPQPWKCLAAHLLTSKNGRLYSDTLNRAHDPLATSFRSEHFLFVFIQQRSTTCRQQ